MRRHRLSCLLLVGLVAVTRPSVAAPRERWGPRPFGLRVREPFPQSDPLPHFEGYAAVLGALFNPWVRWHAETALGGGPGGVSGTFALDLAMGGLIVKQDPRQGLILRGGLDLYVDVLGSSRITRFSIPQVELGYARYRQDHVVDLVLAVGPVLASRMRHGDRLQRLPIALQVGPQLMLQYRYLGARIATGYLPLTTAAGGPALWSRAQFCYAPWLFAACAEGAVAHIDPSRAAPLTFGYAGLMLAFDFDDPWTLDEEH
jgi:hypothetical protein